MPTQTWVLPPIDSDGQPDKWPECPPWKVADDANYRLRLGTALAQKSGTGLSGIEYCLDRLPDGYRVFSRPTPAGNQVYKHLYGHPSGRIYDSIIRFTPHFNWLVDGQKSNCLCDLCNKGKRMVPMKPRKPRNLLDVDGISLSENSPSQSGDDGPHTLGTGFAAERGRRGLRDLTEATYPVDEQGVRHIYKDAIAAVHKNRNSRHGVEFDIIEEDSMDWVAENELLRVYLTTIEQQHSFIPRLGELVLWIPQLAEGLCVLRDPKTGCFQAFNLETRTFVGFPSWRGGIITQLPSNASKDGFIDFSDLLYAPEKKMDLNMSGFKVETMVDPNDDTEKSASKQSRYVPLHYIRPLSQWRELLKGIPQKLLHPSISHALTCMTSLTLVGKYKLRADWKDGGYLLARGCFMGSELITLGDCIRLTPSKDMPDQCTQIMVVEQIKLIMDGFEEQHTRSTSTQICNAHFITFAGQIYTINATEAAAANSQSQTLSASVVQVPSPLSTERVKTTFRPVGTAEFGQWRRMGRVEVSYDQVLGRLYEAEAIKSWSGQRQWKFAVKDRATLTKPDLSYDLSAIIAGRKYATATDERIPDCPTGEIRWHIFDTRVQALTVAYVNGLETSYYDHTRNRHLVDFQRLHLRRAAGKPVDVPVKASRPVDYIPILEEETVSGGKRRGRPAGSKIIDGKMYTADEVRAHPELLGVKGLGTEKEAYVKMDKGEDVYMLQKAPMKASRMAAAAMNEIDTDEDLSDRSRLEDQRLAAYGELSEDEHADKSDENLMRAFQPASKSQIMQSVEKGHGNAVANIADLTEYDSIEYSDEEDIWNSQKLAEWRDPKNARGGTEETEGGDYIDD